MPFAGESEFWSPDSILSHVYGALLPMFTTKEATVLRQLCREFKDMVADFPWEDDKTEVKGSVAHWGACFPRARLARREVSVRAGDAVFFINVSMCFWRGSLRTIGLGINGSQVLVPPPALLCSGWVEGTHSCVSCFETAQPRSTRGPGCTSPSSSLALRLSQYSHRGDGVAEQEAGKFYCLKYV